MLLLNPMLNIVLFSPEIPQNTGNIGRTCVAFGAALHLIEPMGFEITDKVLKRAGLDYWKHLSWKIYKNWNEFLEVNQPEEESLFLMTTKAQRYIGLDQDKFDKDSYFVFGRESAGLPAEIMNQHSNWLKIPQTDNLRSMNLSNCVAISAYEYSRKKTPQLS